MFVKALEKVSVFTTPVIISKRFMDGKVESGCASFIIVNPEGWLLTSAHVLNDVLLAQKHSVELSEYQKKVEEIQADNNLNSKKKGKLISRLTKNPQWITNYSFWWGKDGRQIKDFVLDQLADIALGKLEPFNSNEVAIYPTFRKLTPEIPVGTSLCRLGFPFHDINSTFNDDTKSFQLAPGVLPMPRFPLDGIHTRIAIFVEETTKRQVKFLETSSPGLRGQSGGPIFDIDGNILALQSRTMHFKLGFSPKIKQGNKEVEEHQFLNVGLGVHVEEIVQFLTNNKVAFNVSS